VTGDPAGDATGDGLLGTGEFARRSRLSVKALRLYQRLGLLVPAEVSAAGYRRYRESQLYAARLIGLLRQLDMPLPRVAEIVRAAGADAAGLLADYWDLVERRLASQRDLAELLVHGLAGTAPPPDGWPVAARDIPERLVLTEQRHVLVGELGWIREATARLLRAADRCGGPAGERLVVFHGEVTADSDGPVEVCVPVDPARVDPAAVATRLEPAHREAYVPLTKGHFEVPRILSAYDAVRGWLRDRGHHQTGPSREVYRSGVDPDTAAPTDVVCDVAIPFT
jgi:DNA-binding transcriptional MerR regulator